MLVPWKSAVRRRKLGLFAGQAKIHADFDELPTDIAAAPSLLREARAAIEDGANDVLVSVVTAWEIAIKQSLGKLDLQRPAKRWLPEVIRRSGFDLAGLGFAAALRVRGLPWHHRDPFDRLLIAHALEEGSTIVTRDEVFAEYGVPVLLA